MLQHPQGLELRRGVLTTARPAHLVQETCRALQLLLIKGTDFHIKELPVGLAMDLPCLLIVSLLIIQEFVSNYAANEMVNQVPFDGCLDI